MGGENEGLGSQVKGFFRCRFIYILRVKGGMSVHAGTIS